MDDQIATKSITNCREKIAFFPVLAATVGALLIAVASAGAQTNATGFEGGDITPFSLESIQGNLSEVVTPSAFTARAGDKVHRIVWYADNYNDDRSGRSVEGQSYSLDHITHEGWYGFSFYLPASFPSPQPGDYPEQGQSVVLAQIISWHRNDPGANVTVTVAVDKSGRPILEGAYGTGNYSRTTAVYEPLTSWNYGSLTKDQWHDVVIYCKLSRNGTGILRAWYDGAPQESPTIEATGINLGNGSAWEDDETMTYGCYIKWGPYSWDSDNYVPGESREVFYDEIAYLVGNPENAFDLVKPEGYGEPSPHRYDGDDFSQWLDNAPPTLNVDPKLDGFHDKANGLMPNGLIYALGIGSLDPMRALAKMPFAFLASEGENKYLELCFRQLKHGVGDAIQDTGYFVDGIRYFVEYSHSLMGDDWHVGTENLKVVGPPIDNGDGTESITVRLCNPINHISGHRGFLRLRVEQ